MRSFISQAKESKQGEHHKNGHGIGQAHRYRLSEILGRHCRRISLHFPERIRHGHQYTKEDQHSTSDKEYQILMTFDQSLRKSKCKYCNRCIHSINDTRSEAGHKSGLMSFTQRLLNNKYCNRPDRSRSTHAYKKTLYKIQYHNRQR